MLGVPLDKRIVRVISVEVDESPDPIVDTTPSPYFAAHLLAPQADNSLLDGSPRTSLSPWRLYWDVRGPKLRACERVQIPGDDTYELISKPRVMNSGRRVVGHSCPVLPASLLYPRQADVKALGDETTIATVDCAIYSPRESTLQRGTYEDTFCEMPATAWEVVKELTNAQLHFSDGSVWTLGEATLAPEMPYVNASIRKVA